MEENFLTKFAYFFAEFLLMTALGILFLYVRDLKNKVKTNICENMRLLDGMQHEGVLILCKEDHSVIYCN